MYTNCNKSIKRRIEEELTAPVSLLYDQQVNKFRHDNGSAAAVPIFDRVKSSLYEYRLAKQPPIHKTLTSIDIPDQLTCTLMDQTFYSVIINLVVILQCGHFCPLPPFRFLDSFH
jgi:hypothetical protein